MNRAQPKFLRSPRRKRRGLPINVNKFDNAGEVFVRPDQVESNVIVKKGLLSTAGGSMPMTPKSTSRTVNPCFTF